MNGRRRSSERRRGDCRNIWTKKLKDLKCVLVKYAGILSSITQNRAIKKTLIRPYTFLPMIGCLTKYMTEQANRRKNWNNIMRCFHRISVCIQICRKRCKSIVFSKTDGAVRIGKALVCAWFRRSAGAMKAVSIFASTEWKRGQRSPFVHIIERIVKKNLCSVIIGC